MDIFEPYLEELAFNDQIKKCTSHTKRIEFCQKYLAKYGPKEPEKGPKDPVWYGYDKEIRDPPKDLYSYSFSIANSLGDISIIRNEKAYRMQEAIDAIAAAAFNDGRYKLEEEKDHAIMATRYKFSMRILKP